MEIAAFETFCVTKRELMICRAMRMGAGSRQDAEDIVQVALISCSRRLPLLEAGGIGGYANRALQNAFIDQRRRRAASHDLPMVSDDQVSVMPPMIEGELAISIRLVLRRIPRRYAMAFLMSSEYGLSHAEIAVIERVSTTAIRGRVSKARKAIKSALRSELSHLANAL